MPVTRALGLGLGLALVGLVTGCVDEYDPEVFVVLPDLPDPCGTLGAARATASIETRDGERFEVTSDACQRIGEEAISGFSLALERVTYGYHRATLVIVDGDQRELGRVERPFAASGPLIAPFDYADLPGWPRAPLHVIASCTTMQLTITSTLATRPDFTGEVACDVTLDAPRGPLAIEAHTTEPCGVATAQTSVAPPGDAPGEPLALAFQECP